MSPPTFALHLLAALACLLPVACNVPGPNLQQAELQVSAARSALRDLRMHQEAHGGDSKVADLLEEPLDELAEAIAAARAEGRETADVRELLVAFDVATRPLLAHEDPNVGELVLLARAAVNQLALALLFDPMPPPSTPTATPAPAATESPPAPWPEQR